MVCLLSLEHCCQKRLAPYCRGNVAQGAPGSQHNRHTLQTAFTLAAPALRRRCLLLSASSRCVAIKTCSCSCLHVDTWTQRGGGHPALCRVSVPPFAVPRWAGGGPWATAVHQPMLLLLLLLPLAHTAGVRERFLRGAAHRSAGTYPAEAGGGAVLQWYAASGTICIVWVGLAMPPRPSRRPG